MNLINGVLIILVYKNSYELFINENYHNFIFGTNKNKMIKSTKKIKTFIDTTYHAKFFLA